MTETNIDMHIQGWRSWSRQGLRASSLISNDFHTFNFSQALISLFYSKVTTNSIFSRTAISNNMNYLHKKVWGVSSPGKYTKLEHNI